MTSIWRWTAAVLPEILWHNSYMHARHLIRAVLLIGVTTCLALALPDTSASADKQLTSPVVTFALDFPGANPSHYVISVGHDGRGTYVSTGQLGEQASAADTPAADSESNSSSEKPSSGNSIHTDPPLEFTLSDRVRDQIFDLAQRAHYFSGKVDSGHKNIANTGAKTLTYKDGQRDGQATYNYSTSVPVEQLTAIFQSLSETLEFGRRLSFFHKYQKTALDSDLKRMEELRNENSLGDTQAIASVLKEIADDHSVMNVARARALRLLASAK
jgi:hypothetical protein